MGFGAWAITLVMDEIADRWKDLALTGDEETVFCVGADSPSLPADNVGLCVVGRVLLRMRVNLEAFSSVMKSLWRVHQETQIAPAGHNLFVIQFRSRADKIRVLQSGP